MEEEKASQTEEDETIELVEDLLLIVQRANRTLGDIADGVTNSVGSTSGMRNFHGSKYPENFWQKHAGCIPCAFVCSCCDEMQHRCGGGAAMWVYGRKSRYGDCERMLCDRCYHNKYKQRCSCKIRPGPAPVEIDRETGGRRVRNKCCKCYEYAYPCAGCSLYISDEEREKGNETMTYYEFLDRISRSKRERYPAEYKDFIFKSRTAPVRNRQVNS